MRYEIRYCCLQAYQTCLLQSVAASLGYLSFYFDGEVPTYLTRYTCSDLFYDSCKSSVWTSLTCSHK